MPPHDSIAAIIIKWGDKSFIGSGFLISSNLILTCAHNLHNDKTLAHKKMIKVYVGVLG
jgi:V8-like Glu-specific endopeptidase